MKIDIDSDLKTISVDGVQIYPNILCQTMADLFEQHLGVTEYNGIVIDIQTWYYGRLVKAAWCATSVSYFADKAKVSNQVGKHENCDRMKDFMSAKGKLHKVKRYGGDGKYIPKRGDVVFMSSKNTYNDITHVGVVSSISGNELKVVSGNMKDMIRIDTYYLNTSTYVVAFGEVEY